MNAAVQPVSLKPIRILLVEDVATDAELEIRELWRAGLRIEHRLVDSEDRFRRALADFAPELIISDFSMPHFDGMAALALARELAPEIPFIFVSGTIGEEYAIRAMKNGATDYVLKHNLVRLPPAVERALQDAREHAARLEAESMFRDVLEHAPDPILVVNSAGNIVLANRECEKVFGYRRAELLAGNVEMLVPESLRAAHVAHRAGFLRAPHSRAMGAQLKLVAVHRDGHDIPVEISLAPLGSRRERLVVASIRDQTERRAQEARIARLSRIRDMLGATNAAIVRIRERQALFTELCRIAVSHGKFVLARVVERTRDGSARIAATTESDSRSYQAILDEVNRDPEGVQSLIALALRSGQPLISNDVGLDERVANRAALTAAGSYALALLPIVVEGRVAGVVALRAREPGSFDQEEMRLLDEVVSNIAFALELMEGQAKLDYLAYYDALTGLPNRTLFFDRLGQALNAARHGGENLALMMLDIERFKSINDTFGPHLGDRVLQMLAARLGEVAGDRNRLARLEGNRFAVLFPSLRPSLAEVPNAARAVALTVVEFVRLPIEAEGHKLELTAKAGIAVFPEDGGDAQTLYRNAEASLFRAKKTGERYLFYAPHINARVAEQVELEQRLRRAVDDGELFLHFQPKVELENRRIAGLEALMRWTGPDGKPVSPARFIPLLEETGLIFEAGRQALASAASMHRAWRAAGLNAPRIAVNISALQLRKDNFVDELISTLGDGKDSGVDLEVTESLMMEDVEASIAKLRRAHELGLNIALDDFGTGYSSLAYLSRLPVDTLKIDRSFIRGVAENANDMGLVSTMISLAKALRLKVVAEGVETEEQARLLRLLRCDQMQGYVFSPALPVEKIETLLRGAPA